MSKKIQASLVLTKRQCCDIELLMNGGFAPLSNFLNQTDYERVLREMRLADGQLWPIPIVLDVTPHIAEQALQQGQLLLRHYYGLEIAMLEVTACWQADKPAESAAVYGTDDTNHPGVAYLFNQTQDVYLTGRLQPLNNFPIIDYPELRHSPAQLKQWFETQGWQSIVGFQTRNPMHKAHHDLTLSLAKQIEGNLLLHPVVGETQPGDVDAATRVRCYQAMLPYYPANSVKLSLLSLAMRMAGPREALWHALIRKNFSCTHFIIGRDHAAPKQSNGQSFYPHYAAQELVAMHEKEIGITLLPSQEIVYNKTRHQYMPINHVAKQETMLSVSGSHVRDFLRQGQPVPEWISYPEVVAELKTRYRPTTQKGFAILFSGLPCAGKTVLARALLDRLTAIDKRGISLFDGDQVRQQLFPELGFSHQDRAKNIARIAQLATQVVYHRGIAVCAVIAPYHQDRHAFREAVETVGHFVEIYVATPLPICKTRDTKRMYAKALAHKIEHFTGVDDPYEPPSQPDIIIDTSKQCLPDSITHIIAYLREKCWL